MLVTAHELLRTDHHTSCDASSTPHRKAILQDAVLLLLAANAIQA